VRDPWAIPVPGFEPYAGPADDGLAPLCSKASDLRSFLRSDEVQDLLGQRTKEGPSDGPVMLPDGTPAQLTHKGEVWELMVHIRRDFYKVFRARSRDEVLRLGIAEMQRRTAL
jgi:hypothetical protein